MKIEELVTLANSKQDKRYAHSKELRLEDLVDLNILQKIQDTFARAMGVGAVIVSPTGNEITKPSNFPPICKLIRSTEAGLVRCQRCDARGGLAAYQTGRPYSYMCMSGLMDVAAPIIIEDRYLGCILCGQVLIDDHRDAFVENVTARSRTLGLPLEDVRAAIAKTPTIAHERLDAAAEMLMLTANHIIEIGMANLVQARLLKKSEEKAEVENALRDAKLRALQAQINPHFLFNALTLVSYTALEEHAPKTEEITYILSDLLRYSLRNISTSVALSEEFRMIDYYLSLQQLRFGERFTHNVSLHPSLQELHVPCMVLLPLAENAIVHGVETIAKPVNITVTGSLSGNRVVIDVKDNGVGMKDEYVRALNQNRQIPPSSNRQRPSLGLQSVIRRLEDCYGSDFSFNVSSSPADGTAITLTWPQDEMAKILYSEPAPFMQHDVRSHV